MLKNNKLSSTFIDPWKLIGLDGLDGKEIPACLIRRIIFLMAEGELAVDSRCFQKVLCNPSLLMVIAIDAVKSEYFSTEDVEIAFISKGVDRSKLVTVL